MRPCLLQLLVVRIVVDLSIERQQLCCSWVISKINTLWIFNRRTCYIGFISVLYRINSMYIRKEANYHTNFFFVYRRIDSFMVSFHGQWCQVFDSYMHSLERFNNISLIISYTLDITEFDRQIMSINLEFGLFREFSLMWEYDQAWNDNGRNKVF